jgi:cellulose synthase/poly-beta-1,6-N-acetylglucosamine synthase-like glycosyltransferase
MTTNSHQAEQMKHLPDIDCILIGVNCSKTLGSCIASIISADYPNEKLHLYYVDGGSTDNSIAIAGLYKNVTIIELNLEYPTPGAGRNHGWKQGNSPFVQFLDSDTLLDADWLRKAVNAMDDKRIGAVLGFRTEIYPERSVYNWIGDIEWGRAVGKSDCFGGDVLIRRQALEKTGGYDEILVGGEDPELSRRVIRAGWEIIRLDAFMTKHDLAMKTIKQYLRRAFRSGYGFAAVRSREAKAGTPFWKYDLLKIIIKGGGFLCCSALSCLLLLFAHTITAILAIALLLLAFGSTMLLSPRLFRINKFMHDDKLTRTEAKRYAWHCSLVVLPQLFGVIRFYAGQIFHKPLKNRRNTLKTGLSTPAT